MKLQQLRYACEVARRGLNVSAAAEALHTSQPGISKQIKSLEDELGIEIFVRHGKRIAAVTEPGKAVLAIAERILAEAANLKRAGEEFANEKLGTLTIATTHTQARYALPKAVAAFKKRYPEVHLVLHQGNPTQICEMVRRRRGRPRHRHRIDRRVSGTGVAALLPVEPLRGGAAGASAAEGEAADAGGDRAVPGRDLRLRLRRPLADQQGLREARPGAERRAHRAAIRT